MLRVAAVQTRVSIVAQGKICAHRNDDWSEVTHPRLRLAGVLRVGFCEYFSIRRGDRILADMKYYRSRVPRDQEIVVFKRGRTFFVKRYFSCAEKSGTTWAISSWFCYFELRSLFPRTHCPVTVVQK